MRIRTCLMGILCFILGAGSGQVLASTQQSLAWPQEGSPAFLPMLSFAWVAPKKQAECAILARLTPEEREQMRQQMRQHWREAPMSQREPHRTNRREAQNESFFPARDERSYRQPHSGRPFRNEGNQTSTGREGER